MEHYVQALSNSDKNCRRRSILKKDHAFYRKKRDVTIMTSSGHVTSSEPCSIDSPYASSYSLYVETIPLSGLVSEIFRSKVATMIICDDFISDVVRPGSTIHEDHINTPYRGTLCSSIVQFWQKLPEKKHFKEKKRDVTIVMSSSHVTSSGLCAIDSP